METESGKVKIKDVKVMRVQIGPRGNGGIGMHAVKGCEIALWDLVGKLVNKPLCKILGCGCYTDKVRAYLTSQPRDMLDPGVCKGMG